MGYCRRLWRYNGKRSVAGGVIFSIFSPSIRKLLAPANMKVVVESKKVTTRLLPKSNCHGFNLPLVLGSTGGSALTLLLFSLKRNSTAALRSHSLPNYSQPFISARRTITEIFWQSKVHRIFCSVLIVLPGISETSWLIAVKVCCMWYGGPHQKSWLAPLRRGIAGRLFPGYQVGWG